MGHDLNLALRPLRRWRALLARWAALGTSLAIALAGLVFLGWADLLADFSGLVRLMGLLLLAGGSIASGVAVLAAARSNPRELAALIDRHGSTGGSVLVGVELSETDFRDSLSAQLASAAARNAGALASTVSPRAVQPASSIRRPWLAAAGLAASVALLAFASPAVFFNQLKRVLDPLGDHPPYAPYRFVVEPGDARVFYGDPFSVTARVEGDQLPRRVDWIVEKPGAAPITHPMLDKGNRTFGATMGVVESSFAYTLQGPETRSRRFTVTVINTPKIEAIQVKVSPPAYTRKPAYEGPYPETGIAGVEGTRVSVTAVSNRPLASGRLNSVELKPFQEKSVRGEFELTQDGEFEITVVDVEGNGCREPFRGKTIKIPDRPPSIAMLQPPRESYATPDAIVPIVVEAEDDFGISRLTLYRSLNGTKDHGKDLKLPSEDAIVRLTHPLELKPWGLEPGDVLEFYAVAADNDPRGSKTAETPVHRLRIISTEQFMEMVRNQQRIEDLLERYRPIEEALAKAREAMEELKKALEENPEKAQEAMSKMMQAMADAQKLAREQAALPPIFDIDKEFQDDLRKLAKELEQAEAKAREARDKLAKGGSKEEARKALDDLRKRIGDASEEHKDQVQVPLEALEKLYRLMEYESRFTALAQAQEDLARRMKRFSDREKAEDPQERAEMTRLAQEQQSLEAELREVLEGIRTHAARLPQGEPFDSLREEAEEFATAVTDAKAPEQLEKAHQAMRDKLGRKSAEEARRAADLLMSFVSRCEGLGEGGMKACLSFRPSLGLGSAMQATLAQLLAGMGLPGSGYGMGPAGRGGGASSRRSPGSTGLYGPVPARGGGSTGSPGGSGGQGASGRSGGESDGSGEGDPRVDLIYGGFPIQAVPSEYRAAVREYFRRVAEESGR